MEWAVESGGKRKVDFSAKIYIFWHMYVLEDCIVEGPLHTIPETRKQNEAHCILLFIRLINYKFLIQFRW